MSEKEIKKRRKEEEQNNCRSTRGTGKKRRTKVNIIIEI